MVDQDEESAGPFGSGVEPDRPHHRPGVRVESGAGRLGVAGDGGAQLVLVRPAYVDAGEPGADVGVACCRYAQQPLGFADELGPQHVVPGRECREHRQQAGFGEVGRGLDQGRLVIGGDGTAALQQAAHDRGERGGAGAVVVDGVPFVGAERDGNGRQGGGGSVLEDLPGCDPQTGGAGPGDQLHGDDAVAAEGEEVVVRADRLGGQSEGVREQVAQGALRVVLGARPPPCAVKSGAGRADRSSLPLESSGSRSRTTTAAGTM